MNKLFHHFARKHFLSKGFSTFFADNMSELLHEDLFEVKISLKKKIWALKRSFFSYKIDYYGLTNENYHDFLPDLCYYRMHPINGMFSHWIDDKLTIRYILHPYKEYLPEYYYHLYQGEILRLADCPEKFDSSIESMIELLKEKHALAAKKMIGSHGQGFFKLAHDGDQFFVNDSMVSKEDLVIKLKDWLETMDSGYLVTEFLKPCQVFSQIWEKTANTLRVVVVRNKNQSAAVVDAFLRFGTYATGNVENTTLGGITCRVSVENGHFENAKIIKDRLILDCPYHPDTNQLIEGDVPHWDEIKTKIIEISNFIPHIIYMGYDLVATDDSFKIIEINCQQGIGFNQSYMPYLKDELTKDFFNTQLTRINQENEYLKSRRMINRFITFLKRTKHRLSLLFKK